jgi:membrane protein
MVFDHVLGFGRAVVRASWAVLVEAHGRRLPLLAGSLAFYAFLSVLPLLVLVLIVSSWVAGDVLVSRVLELTRRYLSPSGRMLVTRSIRDASGRFGSSLLSVLVLVWGAFRVFWNLEVVFEELYGVRGEKSVTVLVRDGVVGVVGMGVGVLVVAAGGAVFATRGSGWLAVLNPVVVLVLLSVALLPMYYLFPPVPVSVREVVPGAVVAAGGWALVEVSVQIYAVSTSVSDAYGVLGGVLLLLLWLYFGALVTLLGVVVNVVLAGRAGGASERIGVAVDGEG